MGYEFTDLALSVKTTGWFWEIFWKFLKYNFPEGILGLNIILTLSGIMRRFSLKMLRT